VLPAFAEQEFNCCAEIFQTLLFRFALSVGAGNLWTGRPKSALISFALMNDKSEPFCHDRNTVSSFWGAFNGPAQALASQSDIPLISLR
jgi:hypothetical protein